MFYVFYALHTNVMIYTYGIYLYTQEKCFNKKKQTTKTLHKSKFA